MGHEKRETRRVAVALVLGNQALEQCRKQQETRINEKQQYTGCLAVAQPKKHHRWLYCQEPLPAALGFSSPSFAGTGQLAVPVEPTGNE
jgi:hypothetical protein